MSIEHKNIPDSQLHEVKGAASATSGQVLVANGSGGATFSTLGNYMGWYNYDDSATAGSPISMASAATRYTLTNDALGVNNITDYGLTDVSLWNSSTNRFDFSGLDIGDVVEVRIDVNPTTSGTNRELALEVEIGEGSGASFYLPISTVAYKATDTYRWVSLGSLFIGSALTRDNPARLVISSDSAGGSVTVNGWYVKVQKRSIG